MTSLLEVVQRLLDLLLTTLTCVISAASNTYDYSSLIDEAINRRYCGGTVVEVVPEQTPRLTVEEIMGWRFESWPSYFVVTVHEGKSPNPDDPPDICGEICRYEVGCYDRIVFYHWQPTAGCLHDCVVLGLADEPSRPVRRR